MKKIISGASLIAMLFVLASCGEETTTTETNDTNTPIKVSGVFNADAAATTVGWLGSKASHNHVGTVKLLHGNLELVDGKITSGFFAIDMKSIKENGLGTFENAEKVADLEKHLKDPDFFNVDSFPASKIVITSVTEGADASAPQTINGDLTIKGITKPISFPAKITATESQVKASATFKVNRADFNVRYGSGSFFNDLGDKVISDEMEFSIDLVANK